MRATLTSLVLLAIVSAPASSQISGTILREPKTTFLRLTILNPVNPGTGRRGQQNLTVQLTGLNTHFLAGITTLSMGPGVTLVSPVTVISPTSASAVVNIDAATTAGSRTVTVTTGAEVVALSEGFSVTESPDFFPKSCSTAGNANQGTLYKGMSRQISGIIDLPGVEDWFIVTAPAGTSLKLTLSGVGSSSEFDMSVMTACGSTPTAATASGVTPKQIVIPAGAASQAYLIRVKASQWKAESSRFTLTLVAE
jgi:hypothetical protein